MKLLRNLYSFIIKRPVDENWKIIWTLYHGSNKNIKNGILLKNTAPTKGFTDQTHGVFTTSDYSHALKYAVARTLGNIWFAPDRRGLFIEKKPKTRPKTCYIYEVDSKGFVNDFFNDYHSNKNVKIKKVHKIDIAQEQKSGNLNIYLLTNFDLSNIDDPIEKMNLTYKQILAKKYKKYIL